jgi:hypothetical protein
VAETEARMKASVRTMGPPWELHDVSGDDDMMLLRAQESEVKALYHEIHRTKTMLHGDLCVSDPQGARYDWNRQAFRWDEREAALPQVA